MAIAHLNALRALEAAIRLGSFRAAGAELGVTPAAVGQQVRKLEEALGCTLLLRRANGFEPTAQARAAARHLDAGFAELTEAVRMLRDSASGLALTLTVAPTIGEWWLAPRLDDFLSRHPGTDLRIDTTHQLLVGNTARFDFALRYAPPTPGASEEIELFREWLIPVCTPELAARLAPGDPSDPFRGVPLIRVDRETDDPGWITWDGWGRRFGIAVPDAAQGLKYSRTTLALRSVHDGHGVHLAQLSITAAALRTGRLVMPFGIGRAVQTGYPYRLAIFGARRRAPIYLAFIDWICAEAAATRRAMQVVLGGPIADRQAASCD